MKRVLLISVILVAMLLTACGGGIANNPIEVVDKVKVGMTESQVKEVVDVKYFQDNKSYLMVMISDFQTKEKGFSYTISGDQNAPYFGELFFSVQTDIDVALVVSKWDDTRVVGVGVIPFERAKEIAKEHQTPLWRLRD